MPEVTPKPKKRVLPKPKRQTVARLTVGERLASNTHIDVAKTTAAIFSGIALLMAMWQLLTHPGIAPAVSTTAISLLNALHRWK